MNENNLDLKIDITQIPIIDFNIDSISKSIQKEISEMQLDSQVVTDETKKSIKDKRAKLNKFLKEIDTKRIDIKKQLLEPYDKFEALLKQKITDPINEASKKAGEKINEFEVFKITEKRNGLKEYFKHAFLSEGIDWFDFDSLNLSVTLTSSEKQHKEYILFICDKMKGDLNFINKQDYSTEILIEYKQCLDVYKSIDIVNDRKRLIEAEKSNNTNSNYVNVLQAPKVSNIVTCKLELTGKESDLIKLKQFMKENNINYKIID